MKSIKFLRIGFVLCLVYCVVGCLFRAVMLYHFIRTSAAGAWIYNRISGNGDGNGNGSSEWLSGNRLYTIEIIKHIKPSINENFVVKYPNTHNNTIWQTDILIHNTTQHTHKPYQTPLNIGLVLFCYETDWNCSTETIFFFRRREKVSRANGITAKPYQSQNKIIIKLYHHYNCYVSRQRYVRFYISFVSTDESFELRFGENGNFENHWKKIERSDH